MNAIRKVSEGGERKTTTDKEIKVQKRENWNDFSFGATTVASLAGCEQFIASQTVAECCCSLVASAHRGSRWEIIRSASSGVGGENFSSGGTLGCVEMAACATSSVG